MWVLTHPLHAVQFSTYGYQEKAISAMHFLRDFAKKTIDERKRAIQDGEDVSGDILSYILKMAQQDQSISMEEIIDEFTGFLFAGKMTVVCGVMYQSIPTAGNRLQFCSTLVGIWRETTGGHLTIGKMLVRAEN